jgi:hypothetical protein
MSDDQLAGLPNGLSRVGGIFSRRRLLGTTTMAVAGAALAAGPKRTRNSRKTCGSAKLTRARAIRGRRTKR